MKVIQVGVGGAGGGWLHHVMEDSRTEHVALVDVAPEALAAAREKTGIEENLCFETLTDALRNVQADAVINVTPPQFHRPVSEEAFRAGLHVLTEKPLAESMDDCRAMVDAAEQAGQVLMVSQNYRFAPWARTMRRLLAERVVGNPAGAVVRFRKCTDFRGTFRETMPYPLIIDMSVHHFDLMRYILGTNATSAYAASWRPQWSWFKNDPSASICFEMTDGGRVLYDATWSSRGPDTSWTGLWEIDCDEGQIRYIGERVEIARGDDITPVEPLDEMPVTSIPYSLLHFGDCIENGSEPETSGRDNLGSVAMVFAAVQSARINERVDVAV